MISPFAFDAMMGFETTFCVESENAILAQVVGSVDIDQITLSIVENEVKLFWPSHAVINVPLNILTFAKVELSAKAF